MANTYAESIGGFYGDLGQTGAANDMRESVLAAIDERAEKYSAHLAQNDIYSAITATEKQWLKQDNAYMAAQLRNSVSETQADAEPHAAHKQATYSSSDLQFAGIYASELSNQVEDMSISASVSLDNMKWPHICSNVD